VRGTAARRWYRCSFWVVDHAVKVEVAVWRSPLRSASSWSMAATGIGRHGHQVLVLVAVLLARKRLTAGVSSDACVRSRRVSISKTRRLSSLPSISITCRACCLTLERIRRVSSLPSFKHSQIDLVVCTVYVHDGGRGTEQKRTEGV